MFTTDMVMHVDETLAAESRRNLELTMTSQRGVLDARFNERRPHLMLVSYDRERTITAAGCRRFFCTSPGAHRPAG